MKNSRAIKRTLKKIEEKDPERGFLVEKSSFSS